MTTINHTLTGALIAAAVRQPLIALPLAFISHWVLDAVPHFGPIRPTIFENNRVPIFRIVLVGDIVLTVAAFLLAPILLHKHVHPLLVVASMVAAFLPDTAWVYRFIREIKTKVQIVRYSWFSKLHDKIQWAEKPWGIYAELAYLIIISAGIIVWA